MGISFSPDVSRSLIVGRELGALAVGFRSFRKPLTNVVDEVMIPHIIEQFETGGDPPWEPHADSTVERRARQGTLGQSPQDILIETGRLFDAATKRARWKIDSEQAFFSNLPSNAEYGYFHLTGTDSMPARPFIQMTDQQLDDAQTVFGNWVDEVIAARFLRRAARGL